MKTLPSSIRLTLAAAGSVLLAAGFAFARPQNAPPGDAQAGKGLYSDKTCDQCHGMAGEGAAGPKIAPPPAFADFVMQVRNPIDKMPAFSAAAISDGDLANIYAFLKAPGAAASAAGGQAAPAAMGPGNVQHGAQIFVAFGCYECHGRVAQGGQGTGPRLAPNPPSPAAMIKELRTPNEMPPYSAKTVSDSDINDIHAFLGSLPQPPKIDSIAILAAK